MKKQMIIRVLALVLAGSILSADIATYAASVEMQEPIETQEEMLEEEEFEMESESEEAVIPEEEVQTEPEAIIPQTEGSEAEEQIALTAPEEKSGYTYDILADGTISINGYTGELPQELVIPGTVDGYRVTEIGKMAFDNQTVLTKVTLPDSVVTIEFCAFMGCTNLEEINMPPKLVTIANAAFRQCRSLKKVVLPETLQTLGAFAFGECSTLEEINIPKSITVIPNAVVWECDSLERIELPDTVTAIDLHAFSGCDKLKEIVLQEGVKNIDRFAFWDCTSLERIVLPNSVESIGEYAFSTGNLDEELYENMDLVLGVHERGYAYQWAIQHGFETEPVLAEGTKTGIQQIHGTSYLYDEFGTLVTGYAQYGEDTYYADDHGVLGSGWIKIGDDWRYFDKEQGYREIEASSSDGYWYELSDGRRSYFNKKTTIVKNGWKVLNKQKYYFDEEGFAVTGWYQDGAYWYYAQEDGQMAKGVQTITENETVHTYYFDNNYRLNTGWKKVDGVYRYFQSKKDHKDCYEITMSAASGFVDASNGGKCYIDAKKGAVTGWKTIGAHRYYFDANGFMLTGHFQEGRYHYFAETDQTATESSPLGAVARGIRVEEDKIYGYHSSKYYRMTGWQTIEKQRYYFSSNCTAVTGWYKEGNYWYYAEPIAADGQVQEYPAGSMAKGVREIQGKTYYFDNQYHLITGWVKIGNDWRYFTPAEYAGDCCEETYALTEDGWLVFEDGRKAYINAKNKRITGWLTFDGKKYYLDSDGFLKTGSYIVGTAKYETDAEGAVVKSGAEFTGWQELEGKTYYFTKKGKLTKGWLTLDGEKYYFDTNGVLQTGFVTIGNYQYYFSSDGTMQIGSFFVDGQQYETDKKGILQSGAEQMLGWQRIADQVYYFKTKGKLVKGWQTINKQRYYFDTDGSLKTGWFEIGKKTYYAEPDGTMGEGLGIAAKGVKEIDGETYVFHSSSCQRLTGFQSSGGKRYYLQADGTAKTGWFTVGTDRYYAEEAANADTIRGTLASGAKEMEIDGEKVTYFFHVKSNYRMTGWQTAADKKRFYLQADGSAKTGWFTVSGKLYYAEPETTAEGILRGTVAAGAKEITVGETTQTYVFHTSKNHRLTGFQTVSQKKYYLDSNGVAKTGWFEIGGKWYYGAIETTPEDGLKGTLGFGLKEIDEKYYYFDKNYRLMTGWQKIGQTYHFFEAKEAPQDCCKTNEWSGQNGWVSFHDGSGRKSYFKKKFLTGWQTIDQKKYYFDANGIMQTGWQTISGKAYYFDAQGIYVPMTSPAITSLVSNDYRTADLKWKKISGVKGYRIEYSKNRLFLSWFTSYINIADAETTSCRVTELDSEETYYFRIRYTVWSDDEQAQEAVLSSASAVKSVKVKGETKATATSAEISSCEIIANNGDQEIWINLVASFGETRVKSADDFYYIVETQSFGTGLDRAEPLKQLEKTFDIDVNFWIEGTEDVKEALMNKFAVAIRNEDGKYQVISTPFGITNPECLTHNDAPIAVGESKKGIQGITRAQAKEGNPSYNTDANDANTKQTLLNVMLEDCIANGRQAGFVDYEYKGKTYYFSDFADLQATVRSLNKGYDQYINGRTGEKNEVIVTACLLLRYDSTKTYLIDQAARKSGYKFYTLNVAEQKARETYEALFYYMGEVFGQEDCYITNWVLGNEINSSKAWNYQGSLSYTDYMKRYTTAFRLLYNGVKAAKTGNHVYISLDNGWTAAPDTYAGKKVLDTFADLAQKENPKMEWSIAYHAYSYPLTRCDFWNDNSNTTNSTSTRYISMKNISVLTDYAASLEQTYNKEPGSIRVILSEQGYNSGASNAYGQGSGHALQAEALARAYYTAEFNDRIDAFIIRAVQDAAEEVAGGLYLGLRSQKDKKKIALFVYEYMDSDLDVFTGKAAGSIATSWDHNDQKAASAQSILSARAKKLTAEQKQMLAKMH